MDIYLQLLQIYQSYGINIKTGLYPWHFPIESNEEFLYSKTRFPFTGMVVDNNLLGAGGGIHIMEVFIIASLSSMIKSKKIFIIGNSFGWSTFTLALANPDALVVAVDNISEGTNSKNAFDISRRIAEDHFPNVTIIEGTSPQDVPKIVQNHLGGSIDFALIDGLHTNKQQTLDFNAMKPFLSDDSAVVFHDVLNASLVTSFRSLCRKNPTYLSQILTRTPSGMGVLSSPKANKKIKSVLDGFTEDNNVILYLHRELKYLRAEKTYTEGRVIIDRTQDQRIQPQYLFLNKKNQWLDLKMAESNTTSWGMLPLQPEEDILHSPLFLHKYRLNTFPMLIGTHQLPNKEKRKVLLILGIGKDELLSIMKKRKQLHSLFGELAKPSIMVTHL